jgi:hypothetical protein
LFDDAGSSSIITADSAHSGDAERMFSAYEITGSGQADHSSGDDGSVS